MFCDNINCLVNKLHSSDECSTSVKQPKKICPKKIAKTKKVAEKSSEEEMADLIENRRIAIARENLMRPILMREYTKKMNQMDTSNMNEEQLIEYVIDLSKIGLQTHTNKFYIGG